MEIPGPGEPLETGQSTFNKDLFKIELSGSDRQQFSIIDVPGIFRTPTPGVTTKADMKVVRSIVKSYIRDKRTIILAVIPAPTDIATQEILTVRWKLLSRLALTNNSLQMAEEVDPHGMRTLGM